MNTILGEEVTLNTAVSIVGILIQFVLVISLLIILTGSDIGTQIDSSDTPYQNYVTSLE